MKLVESFDTSVDQLLKTLLDKSVLIKALVHLLLVLYIARLAPSPPPSVLKLFENVYFKLFIFSLVLWTAQFTPSISILIALAFMVTVNYSTTGKLWEMMDNIESAAVPTTQLNAIDAVKILADAAVSSTATSPAVIAPIANVAVSGATTTEGVDAIKSLAEQAITPVAGNEEKVINDSLIAIKSIAPELLKEPELLKGLEPELLKGLEPELAPAPTPAVSVEAVKMLGDAALSPNATSSQSIVSLANVAVSSASTDNGVNAIKNLAEQAVVEEAGDKTKVENAVATAIQSIQNDLTPEPVVTVPANAEQGIKAIQALANAAASPAALNANDVNTVAQIAAANATTVEGVNAIKKLALQAITPQSGTPGDIEATANIAINSVLPSEASTKQELAPVAPVSKPVMNGCYQVRKYDMGNVLPSYDQQSAEDYQEFIPSPSK